MTSTQLLKETMDFIIENKLDSMTNPDKLTILDYERSKTYFITLSKESIKILKEKYNYDLESFVLDYVCRKYNLTYSSIEYMLTSKFTTESIEE